MEHTAEVTTPDSKPARHSRMATAAMVLSIFAFIPPLGIAAVVLGHISKRRIQASHGLLNGEATARAALIIGYTQAALVTAFVLVLWQVLGMTVEDFRRDAMVQRVLRTSDVNQIPDYETAREEEMTARALLFQMAGMEAEHHRKSEQGYLCSLGALLEAGGVEGSTPAEKRAFAERVWHSRYNFEVQGCTPDDSKETTPQYRLTAVPRWPQTPSGKGQWGADEKGAFTRICSPVFCTDESGTVKQIYGGTSADCFDHGDIIP